MLSWWLCIFSCWKHKVSYHFQLVPLLVPLKKEVFREGSLACTFLACLPSINIGTSVDILYWNSTWRVFWVAAITSCKDEALRLIPVSLTGPSLVNAHVIGPEGFCLKVWYCRTCALDLNDFWLILNCNLP